MPTSHHPLEVLTADGVPLAATVYEPDGAAEATVLVVPAMGVGQAYYARFAGWLAGQGFRVLTFDYRGVGRSLRGPLAEVETDLATWGRLDCAAMVDAASARAAGGPLRWIGHSLGGQLLPFVPNLEKVERAVTVATGSGYWLENAWPLRLKVWWLWFFLVPLALPLFGYFPGRRLRKVGDLPRGAMAQWRRWCLDRDYAAGAEGAPVRAAFAAVRLPIHAVSFTDDELMSRRNVEAIHAQYTGAAVTARRLAPADLGVRRIGHFGCFKADLAGPLWQGHLLPALRG